MRKIDRILLTAANSRAKANKQNAKCNFVLSTHTLAQFTTRAWPAQEGGEGENQYNTQHKITRRFLA